MSKSPIALDSSWRDYSGSWNPMVEPLIATLENSNCHVPRLALIPDILHSVIPASGKLLFNFFLVPGSLIWGYWAGGFSSSSMVVQLTDVSMGHKFFQDPVTVQFLQTQGAAVGRFPAVTLLATPHPVVGDGLFTLEVWGQEGDIAQLILAVAEVSDCPAK